MCLRRLSGALAILAALVLATISGSVSAEAPAPTDPAEQLSEMVEFRLTEAKDFFEMGYLDDCAEQWQALLQLDPSPALCLAARTEFGFELFGRMLEEPKLSEHVAEFLKRARGEEDRRYRDPVYTMALADDLQRTPMERQRAIYELGQVGERAVPVLFARLGGAIDERQRVNIKLALEGMGTSAAAPLIEALKVKDEYLRQEVALLLGKARDLRALAPLRALLDDEGQPPAVRSAVGTALGTIFEGAFDRAAADYYYELGELYYYESPEVQPGYFEPPVPLWRWDAEKQAIVSLEVSRRDFYLEHCKQACYDGLAVAPGDVRLNELLVSIYFVEKKEKGEEADEELASRIALLLAGGGKAALLGSLRRQLQDDRPALALDVITVLRPVLAGKGLRGPEAGLAGNPLIQALDFPDQVLNFYAAETLAEAACVTPFQLQERVVPYLSWGLLWGVGVKTALVASEDAELRNAFQGHLRAMGYTVQGVAGLGEAAVASLGLPTPGLVVADAELMADLSPLLLADARTRFACRVAVGPAESEVQAPEGQAELTVPRNITEAELGKVLDELMEKAGVHTRLSVEKEAVAGMAAAALATLSSGVTVFDVGEASAALLLVMDSEDEAVRLAVLKAVGNTRDPAALLPLLEMGADTSRDETTRLAALDAVRVVLGSMSSAGKEVYDTLVGLLEDESEVVRQAGARALSAGPFSAEEIVTVLVEKKVTLERAE